MMHSSSLRRPSKFSPRNGFSVLEVLIAVAIIGVLLGIGVVSLREPSTRLYANDVRAQIQQGRYEAIKRNVPVAVVWDTATSSFETRLDTMAITLADACEASTVIRSSATSTYRNVVVADPDNFGVVWIPSGTGRACPTNVIDEIRIEGNGPTRTVSVTTAGSVNVQ